MAMKRAYIVDKATIGSNTFPPLFAWQPVSSNYLAIVGASSYALRILDRHGGVVDVINLTSSCSGLVWSPDGSTLGILQSQANHLILWKAKDQSEELIETSFKMFTTMAWSSNKEMLAAGTLKGNLLLVLSGGKVIPVLGKHTKSIFYVTWTKQDQVLTVSEDRTMILSNSEGDTLLQVSLKGQPSSPKLCASLNQKVVFLCLLDKKSIYLHPLPSLSSTSSPNLLTLPPKYGDILALEYIESQQAVFVVCLNGLISLISLEPHRLGQERAVSKVFKAGISSMTCMDSKLAFGNEGHIKTLDLSDLKEVLHKFDVTDTPNVVIDFMAWSPDGRFLTLTLGGDVITYVAEASTLAACNGDITAYVTGLTEITVGNETLTVASEPLHMAINSSLLAIGFQNEILIYNLKPLKLNLSIPFTTTLNHLCLSSNYLCILSGSVLHCYSIKNPSRIEEVQIENVHHVGYCMNFIVTASNTTLTYYSTCPLSPTSIYASLPLDLPVTQWIQSPLCASAILISDSNPLFWNPARDHPIPIPCQASHFLWDAFHPNLFYAFTSDTFFSFIYLPYTLNGSPSVHLINQTNVPLGWVPLYATEGQVTCIANQKVHTLCYYDAQALVPLYFLNLHTLLFQKIVAHPSHAELPMVIEHALQALDLNVVYDLFSFSGDLTNALYFKSCLLDEELNVRRGHVLAWYQDYSGAQTMYLKSDQPMHALHLRKDLLQWEQALTLASQLAVEEEPKVCEAYAKQLESDGRYSDALLMYQKAFKGAPSLMHSKHGIAKMKLRMGDFKVVTWILEQNDVNLCLETAKILEDLKEYTNAGLVYEKGKDTEKAAENYLRAQQWSKLQPLLPQTKNPKILTAYAQYLESQQLHEQALPFYERAQDALGLTKMYLAMSRIDEAMMAARHSKSQEAAKLVAQFLTQLGDLTTVMEFYVLAGMHAHAWTLAKEQGLVQQYMEVLGSNVTKDQFLEAAAYFEQQSSSPSSLLLAGHYYLQAEKYDAALAQFLNHPEGMEDAIETVGKAKLDSLTQVLISYLMKLKGPEKPRYIFQLYMKLHQYQDAMRTAIGIAKDEWSVGNYRSARDILFVTLMQLRNAKQRVTGQVIRMLFLLHSYMLVKPLIKLEEHVNSARMLARVSKNISRFQTHVIPILTSTVLECSKAGLLNLAYEFSAQLMRPEYRSQIDPKYKKRIENIVRNHVESETSVFEPTSPCPHCQSPLSITETECNQCQNTIPFCIASGYHMVLEDWSQCPNCTFPALLSCLRKFSEAQFGCPMCGEMMLIENLKLVDNPQLSLSSWKYDEDTMDASSPSTT